MTWLFLLAITLSTYTAYRFIVSPLRSLPGPLTAKLTNLWRLSNVYQGRANSTLHRLHARYGDIVRIGPNCVSVADTSLIKTVFRTRHPFLKSEFYSAGDAVSPGKRVQTTFTTRDEDWHEYIVRPIKNQYSLTSVVRFEDRVDSTIDHLIGKLKSNYAASGGTASKACPIDQLLQHFAFDVVGETVFSERLGLLDGNTEMDKLMKENERGSDYLGLIGQMPWLGSFLKNNFWAIGPRGSALALQYTGTRLKRRVDSGVDTSPPRDFLDLYIEAEKDKSQGGEGVHLTNRQLSWCTFNVSAGSHTVGSELQAAVYHVARDERIHQALTDELRKTFVDGQQPCTFNTCYRLPYLDAVIKEACRHCPAIALPLERVVPDEGLRLPNGAMLEAGTIVAMSAHVINHDTRLFGQDADKFVPERWLRNDDEPEEDYKVRLSKMNEADLTFGAGRRSCIGKNMALLEMYKTIARLFMEFEVR